jgi:uncharacterized membrane protein
MNAVYGGIFILLGIVLMIIGIAVTRQWDKMDNEKRNNFYQDNRY